MFGSIVSLMTSDTCFSNDESSSLSFSINWISVKFDSINDVVNFLREPMLSSTAIDSRTNPTGLKTPKKQRKQSDLDNVTSSTPPLSQPQSSECIQILPKGRVK